MKARFTIILAALLASSLFGGFFQDRNNRTPKGENGDLAEIIGDLKAKISSLEGQVDDLRRNNRDLARQMSERPGKQPDHETDLNRLRARICQLEQENNALRRELAQRLKENNALRQELAQRNDVTEEPVNQPATNRVEGFRRFGSPSSAAEMRARFEEMREKDPERYAQMTNNMARWQAYRQERRQKQFDILASADTKHMTKEQRKVHETYQDLLVRQEELRKMLNPNNTDVTDEQRGAAMKELRDTSRQLHSLQRAERDTLLTQTANALGYKGKDAKEIVDAIKAVYEATGGDGLRGPPGGHGGTGGRGGRRGLNPDQSQAKEGKYTSIKIQVGLTKDKKDAFTFNGEEVDLKRLEEIIKATAATRPEEEVLVCCDVAGSHQALVQVLDICKKYKMTNLSIISMDGKKE